ncbi:MAG: hypothetical protein Q7Q73_02475 [Verrucomicrobiota bacterium JB024]|nr:hypothetical protein [Verrucomicrobiota bacterium JB024]
MDDVIFQHLIQNPALGFFWMPAIMIGVSLAMGVASAAMQSRAQSKAADQAERNAEIDAQRKQQDALEENQQRLDQIKQQREEQRIRRASIEATYAKSGIMLEGSPANLLVEQKRTDEQNAQASVGNANRALAAGLTDADYIRYQGYSTADSLRSQAKSTLFTGILGSAANAATSAAGAYGGSVSMGGGSSSAASGAMFGAKAGTKSIFA